MTDNKLLAIELISSPKRITREQVAELCDISRMQRCRWEQRKDFRKAVDRAIKEKIRGIVTTALTTAEITADLKFMRSVISTAFDVAA